MSLFFDFHFPLDLVKLITDLLHVKNFDPSAPIAPSDTSTREWYSQPRVCTDTTTEVITINFKLPLSVSEFSAEFLRTSCRAEIWYKDRSNNWMQMRDRQRVPAFRPARRGDRARGCAQGPRRRTGRVKLHDGGSGSCRTGHGCHETSVAKSAPSPAG